MPALIVPAAASLAARAVAMGAGKKTLWATLGATGATTVGNWLGLFNDDDISDPIARSEMVIDLGDELRDHMLVPARRPKWAESEEWADKPGRFFVWDYGTDRGHFRWKLITQNMLDGAVEKALTPRSQVRSRPAYRRRK